MANRPGAFTRAVLGAALVAGVICGARPIQSAEGPASQPASQPTAGGTVETLIADLSSTSWQTRQKAQDALAALGEAARPALMQVLRDSQDEETRTRAEAALRQIEVSGNTGPSLLTLHLKDASPQQIFTEISRQAGTRLLPDPMNLWESRAWPAITVDAQQRPFWPVLREVCEKLGVSPHYRGTGLDREMVLTDRAARRIQTDTPSAVSGPFMVVPMMIYTHRSLDFNQPKDSQRSCHLQLMVYPEPKIRVLRASSRAVVQEAVDEQGNTMLVTDEGTDIMPLGGIWARNLIITLSLPSSRTERIARLKASARFVVQTRSQQAEVEDVMAATNVSRTVAGRRFILKQVRRTGDQYVVDMLLFQKDWNPEEWMHMYPGQLFKLLDANGNAYQRVNNGPAGVGQEQSEISLTYQRPASATTVLGEPAKLTWEVPVESKEITVPFEFRDLPVP